MKVKNIISKKLFLLSIVSILAINSNPIKAFASSETITSLEGKDYIEQKSIIESEINNNNNELDNIVIDMEEVKKNIEDTDSKIIDLNSNYRNSKMTVEAKAKPTSNTETLKLLDMVLGSESMSEFFKNLDIAKQVIVTQNKELKNIEKQGELLVEKQKSLLDELEVLETKKETLENENNSLNIKLEEINELISRKGTLTYNSSDLTELSNASLEDVQKILSGTALYDLAPTYIEAEQKYNVNLFFLIGLCANESSWGTSARAVNDNNLTGFGVYYDDSEGINSDSKRNNVLQTAKWLGEEYLTVGGQHYKGKSLENVNSSYAKNADGSINTTWAKTINSISNSLINKLK